MIFICVVNIILFAKLSCDILNQILEKRYETTKHLAICFCMFSIFILDLYVFINTLFINM